jgi:hypothetical protein
MDFPPLPVPVGSPPCTIKSYSKNPPRIIKKKKTQKKHKGLLIPIKQNMSQFLYL